ncbi:uncharacterized protein J3D65DRAFT_633577 [Phyllosticta citribraziliensis]|uniref:Uncharacterized protein n=1 Tax=Phyllosticta citribraziliensis TaxID=989973 RepID=A0ABR1LCA7_9PEZI
MAYRQSIPCVDTFTCRRTPPTHARTHADEERKPPPPPLPPAAGPRRLPSVLVAVLASPNTKNITKKPRALRRLPPPAIACQASSPKPNSTPPPSCHVSRPYTALRAYCMYVPFLLMVPHCTHCCLRRLSRRLRSECWLARLSLLPSPLAYYSTCTRLPCCGAAARMPGCCMHTDHVFNICSSLCFLGRAKLLLLLLLAAG